MTSDERAPFDWALWFLWVMATTLGWLIGSSLLPGGVPIVVAGVAISGFQWAVLYRRIYKAWRWVIVSSIGWAFGWLIIVFVLPEELDLLAGILIGTTTGVAQWLLLRIELRWAGWWIPVSILAWTTGLTLLPGIMLSGMLPGVLTGIALELLLRNPKPRGNTPN